MSLAFVSGKDSLPVDLPKPIENEKTVEVAHSNVKPFSVHPLPLVCIITFCMLRKYLAQEYIGAHVHTLKFFFLDNGIKKYPSLCRCYLLVLYPFLLKIA